MAKFFKRLFAWWDGATLGTLWQIARNGRKVGEDEYGNRYYEQRRGSYDGRKRRWVTYKGYADASRVPAEWHGWLHYSFDEPPTEQTLKRHIWEKDHLPNLTGTVYAFKPKGSLDRPGDRDRVLGDYEAWSPDA